MSFYEQKHNFTGSTSRKFDVELTVKNMETYPKGGTLAGATCIMYAPKDYRVENQ